MVAKAFSMVAGRVPSAAKNWTLTFAFAFAAASAATVLCFSERETSAISKP